MRRALLATLVALAAAGVLLGRSGDAPDTRDAAATAAPVDPTAPDVPVVGAADFDRDPDSGLVRPKSLRGTRTDGGLAVDADGHFVPTIDARRLFDYFLTASGEVPDADLAARVRQEIARRLAAEPAREATTLFERYLAYRERVRALATADVPDLDDLDTRLATLIALRREMLGPEAADAFFAGEEADARRMLEARRIADDDSLSIEERAARVEKLFAAGDANLPPEVREARATARLAATVRDAEAEVRAGGGGDAEIAAMRARLAGPEAAARLAELDQRRNAWRSRVAAFRDARARLQEDATLAPDARAAAIARLLDDSFTPAERRRVEALDRMAAEPATP
jgi:lipase chaperone LimK